MTSVDSGVETSNDSTDSCANGPALNIDDPPPPIRISLKVTHFEKMSEEAAASSSSSSSENEGPKPTPKNRSIKLPDITWPCLEPPAGLFFCNLKPSSSTLNYGTGYEVVGTNRRESRAYVCPLYARFPPFTGKLRTIKYCQYRRNQSSWLKFKTPLDERKLRHAASTNNVDYAKVLLSSGVNPNCMDDQRRSPLHLAACRGYSEIVKLLLDNGANPNQRDSLGNTPLHLAACTNNVSVVTLLLRAGTDVSSSDHFGRNPLQLAQSKLKLLQLVKSEDSAALKAQVQQVVEMMQTFLSKKGCDCEAELIGAFANRLTLSKTKEEVETDVRDLLDSLTNLSIDKK